MYTSLAWPISYYTPPAAAWGRKSSRGDPCNPPKGLAAPLIPAQVYAWEGTPVLPKGLAAPLIPAQVYAWEGTPVLPKGRPALLIPAKFTPGKALLQLQRGWPPL